ncbi:MAG: type II secretion system protein GspJ, partial [Sphingomonas sp.]
VLRSNGIETRQMFLVGTGYARRPNVGVN